MDGFRGHLRKKKKRQKNSKNKAFGEGATNYGVIGLYQFEVIACLTHPMHDLRVRRTKVVKVEN